MSRFFIATIFFSSLLFIQSTFASARKPCLVIVSQGPNPIERSSSDMAKIISKQLGNENHCDLVYHSEILSILSRYENVLPEYLKNPEVIDLIRARTGAEEIFHFHLATTRPMSFAFQVIDSQSQRRNFERRWQWESSEEPYVWSQSIELSNKWIREFIKSARFSFDGIVTTTSSEFVGINFVSEAKEIAKEGMSIVIYDELGQNIIAKGKIETMSLAVPRVKLYETTSAVKVGQPIVLKTDLEEAVVDSSQFENFASLRLLATASGSSPLGFLGLGDDGVTGAFGFLLEGNYRFKRIEIDGHFARRAGDLTYSGVVLPTQTLSLKTVTFGLSSVYNFYFQGPLSSVGLGAGLRRYTYNIDSIQSLGFDDFVYTVYSLRTTFSVFPYFQKWDFTGFLEYGVVSNFEEKSGQIGSSEDVTSYRYGMDISYLISSRLKLTTTYRYLLNEVTIGSSNGSVSFDEFIFGFGIESRF